MRGFGIALLGGLSALALGGCELTYLTGDGDPLDLSCEDWGGVASDRGEELDALAAIAEEETASATPRPSREDLARDIKDNILEICQNRGPDGVPARRAIDVTVATATGGGEESVTTPVETRTRPTPPPSPDPGVSESPSAQRDCQASGRYYTEQGGVGRCVDQAICQSLGFEADITLGCVDPNVPDPPPIECPPGQIPGVDGGCIPDPPTDPPSGGDPDFEPPCPGGGERRGGQCF